MFEGVLAWMLRTKAQKLLQRFTSANLEVHLRSGVMLLQDLELSAAALAELTAMPAIDVKSARIGRLEVLLPWRSSPPAPLVVKLDGVRLVLGPLEHGGLGSEKLRAWRRQHKQQGLLGQTSAGPSDGGGSSGPAASGASPLDGWKMRSAIDALLRDLQVAVTARWRAARRALRRAQRGARAPPRVPRRGGGERAVRGAAGRARVAALAPPSLALRLDAHRGGARAVVDALEGEAAMRSRGKPATRVGTGTGAGRYRWCEA